MKNFRLSIFNDNLQQHEIAARGKILEYLNSIRKQKGNQKLGKMWEFSFYSFIIKTFHVHVSFIIQSKAEKDEH